VIEGAAGYPPIGDDAAIGDCGTAALVNRSGGIDWLGLPHFSGPAVFSALLDRRWGGHFTVVPTGPATARRRYLESTNVVGGGIGPLREIIRVPEVLARSTSLVSRALISAVIQLGFASGERSVGAARIGEHWLLLRTELPPVLNEA
jgi:hypothetical protein